MGPYRALARPVFFSLPPEAAHHLAQALLRLPLPWKAIGAVADDPALEIELAGIRLRNPVGLAAGFDKSCRALGARSGQRGAPAHDLGGAREPKTEAALREGAAVSHAGGAGGRAGRGGDRSAGRSRRSHLFEHLPGEGHTPRDG